MTEAEVQEQIAMYLGIRYPNVLFHSDFGSGIKLTPGQAKKQKRQNAGRRGWPDMFIAKPKKIPRPGLRPVARYHGLFLELKKEDTRLKKKNGQWATPHIAEQAEVLDQLRINGYAAEFVCGFDEARMLIDRYLGDKER